MSREQPDGLNVEYLGGLPDAPRHRAFDLWKVGLYPEGVFLYHGAQRASFAYHWSFVNSEPWAQIRAFHFASTQAIRVQVPALANFGLLGLADSQELGTYIAIRFERSDAFFLTKSPTPTLRAQFTNFVDEEAPEAYGRILVNGVPVGTRRSS